MLIKRTSLISKVEREMEIEVTETQMERFENRHITGELIQEIFPDLSASDREFILTGITDEEWNNLFEEDDDD
jgi:hypothetical protein